MNARSNVAWRERFNQDEQATTQHAMNLKFEDEDAFFAEYQPMPEETVIDGMLKAEEVTSKINRLDRGSISIGVNHLTALIDVQQ